MTEYTIRRLGHHGDGIADAPRGPIFAPFTLPGEIVIGDAEGDRIAQPRIVTPSSDRVKPPCPHFKSCGGCALQHASDSFLEIWKTDIVKTALLAQGIEASFRPIVTSPPQSRRRATLAGRRTKKGAMVGFHGRASDTIIEIPSCTLLHPDIMAGIPALMALTLQGASRKGTISLTVTHSTSGLDVSVSEARDPDGPMLAALGQLAQQHKLARLCWNSEVIATGQTPVQVFDTVDVAPPPGSFLQATQTGQNALIAAVKDCVGNAARVVDLFAGCGTFSLPLARQAEVLAVESEPSQTTALDAAWRKGTGLKPVRTETRDLFRRPLLADELKPFNAAVIDPPRAGAKAQTEALAASTINVIAFVSCNPATFARDAAMLIAAGFTLDWIAVIDQFRWSPHVELVARFERK